MQDGNKKYGRLNWRKGMSQEVILDSLLRHIQALRDGEVFVPDSEHGATHWDAVMSNAMMLSELRPARVVDTAEGDIEVPCGGLWGTKGVDADGFCLLTGFDRDGNHRLCSNKDPLCNCPACR
jgi:hypothetical protein